MPIRPDLKHFYGKQWRTEIRPGILKRAKNKCESCGKPNLQKVFTYTGHGKMFWTLVEVKGKEAIYYDQEGKRVRNHPYSEDWVHGLPRQIKVVLTVAHLNHVPGDDRDENLRALCQWCHLHLDRTQHKESREVRKDSRRPLLAGVSNA